MRVCVCCVCVCDGMKRALDVYCVRACFWACLCVRASERASERAQGWARVHVSVLNTVWVPSRHSRRLLEG